MAHCINCGTILGDEVKICPICDSEQVYNDNPGIDNIDKKLNSTPSLLIRAAEAVNSNNEEATLEVERLIKRGDECYKAGKAWLGAKDRPRARKEFQRAFKYYETVLKIDPENQDAREARTKCLFKMA